MEGKKQAKALNQWPIAKMVEYICYNVDLADKKKKDESADGPVEIEQVDDCSQVKVETEWDNREEVNEVDGVEKDDDTAVVEASSVLLASIDIAKFLSEEGACAPTYYIRTLAKILGSASIDVDAEDKVLLSRLKSNATEAAEYSTDDGPTLNQINKLLTLLSDVADVEDERSYSSEDSKEEEEEEEEEFDEESVRITTDREDVADESFTTATIEENVENKMFRLSMDSIKSVKGKEKGVKTETPSKRVSLGAVN